MHGVTLVSDIFDDGIGGQYEGGILGPPGAAGQPLRAVYLGSLEVLHL